MKKYYGFWYASRPTTTIGDPHHRTGWYSIAGYLRVFDSEVARDSWVAESIDTPAMGGPDRRALTYIQARCHRLGLTADEFARLYT